MGKIEAQQAFKEANTLWFTRGLTYQALQHYQRAIQQDPTDPVANYQLGCVLYTLARWDEAREMLDKARHNQDRLSEKGIQILTDEERRFANPPASTTSLSFAPAELDVQRLEARGMSSDEWLKVAFEAEKREMFGLAAYAYARTGSFSSTLFLEEEKTMAREAQMQLNRLYVMRPKEERN